MLFIHKILRSNKINYIFLPPKNNRKNQLKNQKYVPIKIIEKEINQIKYLKTVGYLDTKDEDKIK